MTETNRQQYDRHASAYHAKRLDPVRGFYNDRIEQPMMARLLKGEARGKRVLEIGCGSGLLTRKLIRMGGIVTGLDNSAGMIEIARGEIPQGRFVKADMRKLPFPSRSFDLVVSSLAFHYVRDLAKIMGECSRVIAPGRKLVFSMHHPLASYALLTPSGRKGKNARKSYFELQPYRWRMLPGMKLISHHQTFESIFASLTKQNFNIEELREAKPSKSSRRINPAAYDETSRYPTFVGIKAVRSVRTGKRTQ